MLSRLTSRALKLIPYPEYQLTQVKHYRINNGCLLPRKYHNNSVRNENRINIRTSTPKPDKKKADIKTLGFIHKYVRNPSYFETDFTKLSVGYVGNSDVNRIKSFNILKLMLEPNKLSEYSPGPEIVELIIKTIIWHINLYQNSLEQDKLTGLRKEAVPNIIRLSKMCDSLYQSLSSGSIKTYDEKIFQYHLEMKFIICFNKVKEYNKAYQIWQESNDKELWLYLPIKEREQHVAVGVDLKILNGESIKKVEDYYKNNSKYNSFEGTVALIKGYLKYNYCDKATKLLEELEKSINLDNNTFREEILMKLYELFIKNKGIDLNQSITYINLIGESDLKVYLNHDSLVNFLGKVENDSTIQLDDAIKICLGSYFLFTQNKIQQFLKTKILFNGIINCLLSKVEDNPTSIETFWNGLDYILESIIPFLHGNPIVLVCECLLKIMNSPQAKFLLPKNNIMDKVDSVAKKLDSLQSLSTTQHLMDFHNFRLYILTYLTPSPEIVEKEFKDLMSLYDRSKEKPTSKPFIDLTHILTKIKSLTKQQKNDIYIRMRNIYGPYCLTGKFMYNADMTAVKLLDKELQPILLSGWGKKINQEQILSFKYLIPYRAKIMRGVFEAHNRELNKGRLW